MFEPRPDIENKLIDLAGEIRYARGALSTCITPGHFEPDPTPRHPGARSDPASLGEPVPWGEWSAWECDLTPDPARQEQEGIRP